MGTKAALIFGSVPYDDWSFLAPLRGKVLVICADGGLLCAAQAGFAPDVYVGDSDSGGFPPPGVESLRLPPEKNLTDLQAAYELARDRGCGEIFLTACTGGRQDHHLANLLLLESAWADGVQMAMLDPDNEIRYLRGGEVTLAPGAFRYFSIVPLDRELRNVRIQDAKYPLEAEAVRRGDSLTVSNETLPDRPARISIGSGAAWIIRAGRLPVR